MISCLQPTQCLKNTAYTTIALILTLVFMLITMNSFMVESLSAVHITDIFKQHSNWSFHYMVLLICCFTSVNPVTVHVYRLR